MRREDSQQIIRADRGGVIQNVTQIIQSGVQDIAFSGDSAEQVSNRISQETVLAIARRELQRYFWRPSDIDRALMDVEIQGWSVPLWRLRGAVLATWTAWREEVISKTEDEEQRQWVPDQDRTTQDLDWLVAAHRPTNNALRAVNEAVEALSRGEQAMRIDWQGYPLGEQLERIWPNWQTVFRGLAWQRKSVMANAETLLTGPAPVSDFGEEDASVPTGLPKLEPETSLLTAINRTDWQIDDCLRNWASKSSQRLADFRHKLDVYYAEQYWFPIWLVQYVYHSRRHYVAINGYNGRLIDALLPMSFRSGFIVSGITTLVLVVMFWPPAVCLLYHTFSTSIAELRIFALIGILVSLFAAVIPFVVVALLSLIWWIRHH